MMRPLVSRFFLLPAALTLLSAACGSARAAEPDSSSMSFQDWTVNCTHPVPPKAGDPKAGDPKAGDPKASDKPDPKAAAPICEMVQSFVEKDSQRVVARIAIGKPPGANDAKLVIQLPVGVWLPDGVSVAVSNTLVAKAIYTRCAPAVCLAETDAKKDFLDGAKTAEKLVLTFSDGARRGVSLNVSTKGFAAALAALDKK